VPYFDGDERAVHAVRNGPMANGALNERAQLISNAPYQLIAAGGGMFVAVQVDATAAWWPL
jgi:hypothetical protein